MRLERDIQAKYWRKIAFCAYYGHQPISEIRALSIVELNLFFDSLADLVQRAPSMRIG